MQMTAFPVGIERPTEIAGVKLDQEVDDWCAFIYPANLAGVPAVSIPFGIDDEGLPIGLQLMSGPLRDDELLATAEAVTQLLSRAGSC
jgi:Asp-tRNA(Asn)/Glu-tRNA(Gln) amidotransferase A subunit family amidase